MEKIILINSEYIYECIKLIKSNKKEFDYFRQLGWSKDQFLIQIDKKINFSIGLVQKNRLIGFIIGDLINVEKKLEYEILLIYIEKKYRKKGYATLLIRWITKKFDKTLYKISLEVAENNLVAKNFYKKNKFKKVGYRKKYYHVMNKLDNALIYERKIDAK